MSITFGGYTLPLSYPETGGVPVALKEIAFPGVDGEQALNMGKRKRALRVRGRLPDADGGTPSAAHIEGLNQGTVGTLVIHGRSFPNCRVSDSRCSDYATVTIGGVTSKTCLYEIAFEQLQE